MGEDDKVLKEQVVNDEVLSTFLTEATNILNSRPLTRNSDDPTDENHLLQITCYSCDHVLVCPPVLQTTVDTGPIPSKPVLEEVDQRISPYSSKKKEVE